MKELIDRGAQNVAVTMGSAGAVFTDGRAFWHGTAPPVTVVSAIGSGDAFAAAMGVCRLRNMGVPDSLRLALACGTANALTPQAGFLDAATVAILEKQVEIREIGR
jgi:fructose-1-phosphate kinase PfkB-like protein